MAAATVGTSQEDPTRENEAAEMGAVADATGEVVATGGHTSSESDQKSPVSKGADKHSKIIQNTL